MGGNCTHVIRVMRQRTLHRSRTIPKQTYVSFLFFALSSHALLPFAAYDARLVDVWACGIVYYCLHFSELPWRSAQPSDSLFAAYISACSSSTAYIASCPSTINNLNPRQCRPVLRKMLEPDPSKRLTIEQVMKETWVMKIEVCVDDVTGSVDFGHVHSCAKAMGEKNIAMLR